MGTVPKGQVIETDFIIQQHRRLGPRHHRRAARPAAARSPPSTSWSSPAPRARSHTSVDTKSFSGPISKSVLVVSNDPERPQMNLFVKAVVKPFVDVAPQAYVRFSVVKGDPASQDVILISEEKGFKPTVAETAQPYVKAEISPAGDKDKIAGRPGEQYKLAIAVTADAPEGLLERADPDQHRRVAAADARGAGLRHRAPARVGHADHGQLRQLHRRQGPDHAQHRRDEQQAGHADQGHQGRGQRCRAS